MSRQWVADHQTNELLILYRSGTTVFTFKAVSLPSGMLRLPSDSRDNRYQYQPANRAGCPVQILRRYFAASQNLNDKSLGRTSRR